MTSGTDHNIYGQLSHTKIGGGGIMKLVRLLFVIGILAGLALAVGCSADLHNPTANELDVQIVGDSVFDLSGEIQTNLKTLSGGYMYKDRSVSGAKIAAIQSQLNTALGRTTLKTVIADGGANDILQGTADCDTDLAGGVPTPGCIDVLNYIGGKMDQMLYSMYTKSPDYCVWLGYYHVKGDKATKNEAIDWAYIHLYPGIFDYTGVIYVYVDPRVGPYQITPADIKSDNIHPTSSGSQKLANLIWNKMVEQKMFLHK